MEDVEVRVCRLCRNFISYNDFEVIDNVKKYIHSLLLLELNIDDGIQCTVCSSCFAKLWAASNFKAMCLNTNFPINDNKNQTLPSSKKMYAKEEGNQKQSVLLDGQKMCQLCCQEVGNDYASINEVADDEIRLYIPEIDFKATANPIICRICFDSLCGHSSFLKSFLYWEKNIIKDGNHIYLIDSNIKTEAIEIKPEENFEAQVDIKIEYNELKREEKCVLRDTPSDTLQGILDIKIESKDSLDDAKQTEMAVESVFTKNKCTKCKYETTSMRKFTHHELQHKISLELQVERPVKSKRREKYPNNKRNRQLSRKNDSKEQMYECEKCNCKLKSLAILKVHQLVHKAPSEVPMYKCASCAYETKRKNSLELHQLKHKDSSEVQMYKCDSCTYETKYEAVLRSHLLTHKDPSEVRMYRCTSCMFETKRKPSLIRHQLLHQDPSEVRVYQCASCPFETIHKRYLRIHVLRHRDPSEVQIYRCASCTFETKRKKYLEEHHQLLHKRPSSNVLTYGCGLCTFKTKHKGCLRAHVVRRHKDHSREQISFLCL